MNRMIRRTIGMLLAMMMVFGGVTVPADNRATNAMAADDEPGIIEKAEQLNEISLEGADADSAKWLQMKTLYDYYCLYKESFEDQSPENVLADQGWGELSPVAQELFRTLINLPEVDWDSLMASGESFPENVEDIVDPTGLNLGAGSGNENYDEAVIGGVYDLPDPELLPGETGNTENDNALIPSPILELDEVTDPVGDAVDDPVTDPVVDAVDDPVTDPVVDAVDDPATDPVVDAADDPVTDPVVDAVNDPVTDPVADAVNDPVTDPVVDAADDPVTDPVADAADGPATDPVVDAAEDPADGTGDQTVTDPVINAGDEQVTDSVLDTEKELSGDSVIDPVENTADGPEENSGTGKSEDSENNTELKEPEEDKETASNEEAVADDAVQNQDNPAQPAQSIPEDSKEESESNQENEILIPDNLQEAEAPLQLNGAKDLNITTLSVPKIGLKNAPSAGPLRAGGAPVEVEGAVAVQYTYTGSPCVPTVTFTANGETKELTCGTDYTIAYSKEDGTSLSEAPTDVGTYTLTIEAVDGSQYKITNLDSLKNKSFTINQKPIFWSISEDSKTSVYSGTAFKPIPNYEPNPITEGLKANVTYTADSGSALTDGEPINAGSYRAVVTLSAMDGSSVNVNNYSLQLKNGGTDAFTIKQKQISWSIIGDKTKVYDGKAFKPTLSYGSAIPEGLEANVKYKDASGSELTGEPVDAGSYRAVVELSAMEGSSVNVNNYSLQLNEEGADAFTIEPKPISWSISEDSKTSVYSGKEFNPTLTYDPESPPSGLTANVEYEAGTDSALTNDKPVNAGSYRAKEVTLSGEGAGNYSLQLKKEEGADAFEITKAIISSAVLTPNRVLATVVEGDLKNWKDEITVSGDTPVPDGKIFLKITTENSLVLTSAEAKLDNDPTEIKEVGTYTIKWNLTEEGEKNFEVPEGTELQPILKVTGITAYWNGENAGRITYTGENLIDVLTDALVVKEVKEDRTEGDALSTDDYSVLIDGNIVTEGTEGTEVVNAGIYKVKVKGKKEYEGSESDELEYEVVPAVVVTEGENAPSLTYDEATYDRHDWSENLYLLGDPVPATEKYANVITAYAVAAANTSNKDDARWPVKINLKEESFSLEKTEMIKAGDYKDSIKVTVSKNYQVGEGENSKKEFSLVFKVKKAVIDTASLDYTAGYYDRHNWNDNIKTYDAEKEDFNNILTVTTVPVYTPGESTGDTTFLTLNEDPEHTGEYSIKKDNDIITAGNDYKVEWILEDKDNFEFSEGTEEKLTKLAFEVKKAVIDKVTIRREDSQEAGTSATTEYDAADWAPRISINSASGAHHNFTVEAYTAAQTITFGIDENATTYTVPSLLLNDKDLTEYSLSYNPAKIVEAGTYSVLANLKDTENFVFASGLEPTENQVSLPFTVTRYQALPITDGTESVIGPSKTSVVKYSGVYRFGPSQDAGARTLTFIGEPGEEVFVTIGEQTVKTKFSGTRFDNYAGNGTDAKTGMLILSISSSGIVTVGDETETMTLPADKDTAITLAYVDLNNLKDDTEEAAPSALTVTAHFDTVQPQIEEAISSFLNRDASITFVVPEAGRLDYITFDEATRIDSKLYTNAGDPYGPEFTDTLDVSWNADSNPHLIHSGPDAIEMKYTDLVCNETTARFGIGQSVGAQVNITIEPIIVTDMERIDMNERPQQVKVTVEGTGYELMHMTLTPGDSEEVSEIATGSGEWNQNSTGEWSTVVNTSSFINDEEITCSVRYDDLIGNEEFHFYFDELADPLIITIPQITEDNWVIPGIAESGSDITIYVDGERVTNTKRDPYTVFAGRKPQLEVGSQVRIVASDLSNNRAEYITTVQPSPVDGTQTLDAYAMGKVFTNAHTVKESPQWLMAAFYTEEELKNGVTVPLVAANSFNIGQVTMKITGEQLDYRFTPENGVSLSGEKITVQLAPDKVFRMNDFLEGTGKEPANSIGYWISAYAQAKVPVDMLHQTFQLDENQAEIRSFYFNRQRLQPMPTEDEQK